VVSLLAAEGLVFDYAGPLRAVDGVDLELRGGELAALIGPTARARARSCAASPGWRGRRWDV
jgi:ABC-type branched-subunit amino acid transport system ATPase component